MSKKPAKGKTQAAEKPAKKSAKVVESEPAEKISAPANGPTADELDAVGAQIVEPIVEVHENKPGDERVEDTSPANQPELVPDGAFHGKWNLGVAVDFINAAGKDTHIDAGVIEGSDLPEEFANDLYVRDQLRKA